MLVQPWKTRIIVDWERFVWKPQELLEYHGVPFVWNLDQDRIGFSGILRVFYGLRVALTLSDDAGLILR